MKKLTLLAVVGTFGLFGLSASAKLPAGLESVNIKTTVYTESGAKVVTTKITTDDILTLIDNEYGTSYAKQDGGIGYQLASYGLWEKTLCVVDKDGNIVLSNATDDGDDYYLYIDPNNDDNWVESYKGENYNYTIPNAELKYLSSDDNDSFYVYGLLTDKVNWSSDNESYSMKNAQGSIYFDDEGIYGPMTGSVSGSGKDVDRPFNW